MSGVRMRGRAIIVTGSARGLGRAYVEHLVSQGALVVMNDIDDELLRAVAGEIDPSGDRVRWCAGSVTDPATADRLVACSLSEFGRLDGLVNNAGIRPEGLSWQESPETTRLAVEVNLLGTLYCGSAALRAFAEEGGGSIVNVSSRAQAGIPQSATYAATKGAVASLTYSWALDAPEGVRVNAIAPQARDTGTRRARSIPRPEEPEAREMAPLVTYLLSDASSAVNGQVVRLVGTPEGLALGFMDHPRDRLLITSPAWTSESIARAFESDLAAAQIHVGA